MFSEREAEMLRRHRNVRCVLGVICVLVVIGLHIPGCSWHSCALSEPVLSASEARLLVALDEAPTREFLAAVRQWESASVLTSVTGAIEERLTSSNPQSRIRAALFLGAVASREEIELPCALLGLATSPLDTDRLAAAISLRPFIGREPAVTESLVSLAKDSSGRVTHRARLALGSNPETIWTALSLGSYRGGTGSGIPDPLMCLADEIQFYLGSEFRYCSYFSSD